MVYGNKQLFVGSDECIKPPDATGSSMPPAQASFFHPNPPIISAPIELRLLLLSLEQAAYSKSIANITPLNSTIAFQSNDDNGTVMCVIDGGLYPNGASVALAINNNSIARTDSSLVSYVVCSYSTTSSRFVFTVSPQPRVGSGVRFRIASGSTTCGDILGITPSQMDTWPTQIESIISLSSRPLSPRPCNAAAPKGPAFLFLKLLLESHTAHSQRPL